MKMKNRWFTKDGKRKRIPANLEPFRSFMHGMRDYLLLDHINIIKIVTEIRTQYKLGIAEALNLAVYLIGCYNNGETLYNQTKYAQGEIVAKTLLESTK